jgi:two-component system cell cycle sensor histidine kinase/response regulator CckA
VRLARLVTPFYFAGYCLLGAGISPLARAEASGAGAAPPAVAPIVVGCPADSYPYSFQKGNGVDGFTVELFDAVVRTMGLHVRREVTRSIDMQTHFVQGDFDMVLMYSHSKSREAFADFSTPYLTLQGGVFVRQDGSVRQYDDLNGKVFAIIGRGSVGEVFLQEHHLHAQQVYASSSGEALRWVQAGTCAGTFVSRLTALSVMEHDGLKGLAILGGPLPEYQIRQSFAVHKGNALLLAQLNEGLAIIHRTGEFDEIYRRWFGRIDAPLFTPRQIFAYLVTALALALLAALVGFFWQTTLRRRIARQAAELAEQRELLQALYDHIPVGLSVIKLAADGPRLISMNRAAGRLYGVDPETTLNRRLTDLALPAGPRHHLEEVLRRRPADEKIVHYEHEIDGSRGVLEVMIVPLSPEAGDFPRLCVLAEDISARKLLDAEVAQSRKLRAVGELVGGIAHEFNNLLTPMMLKVGMIEMDWAGDARLQEEIAVILQAAQRASELTRRLLTFGRKAGTQGESVHLSDMVTNCFELLRPAIDRRITWERDIPSGLPPLRFNATDLNQILLNLLLNARDTLMEKLSLPHEDEWVARIHVSVTALPASAEPVRKSHPGGPILGWQKLTVEDSGLGMSPAVVERIFEPFFTTKDVGKGTGLGLATVWHLVTEAGGRVEVDSQPCAGTAFHLFLPVWPTADQPAPKPAAGIAAAPRPVRVLLIEDENLVAQTVTAILRRGGHEVRHIDDGAAAWKHLAENASKYELLVVDVNLPGLSGLEVVKRLRERNYPGRILVVGGRLGLADLRSLVQLRVNRVLTKPFTAQQFETALAECLA